MSLLEGKSLSKRFALGAHPFSPPSQWVQAVSEVNFKIHEGESVGLVGESGCGKTTLGRMLIGLLEPSGGEVRFRGAPIQNLHGAGLKRFRQQVQMVFQDSAASLDPLMRVGEILAEPLQIHGFSREKIKKRLPGMLEEVGLDPDLAGRFPSELSGGQRQRVGIARALALDPKLLICDEPVSSLDLPVQAQILRLFLSLQKKRELSLLFISHNLAVVSSLCQRMLVMKAGKVLEEGETLTLIRQPRHPYTRSLVDLARA